MVTGRFNFIYRETSPREMARLTNRAAVEMLTNYHTANKAHNIIKIIKACGKTVYVLTQLNCVNTSIM